MQNEIVSQFTAAAVVVYALQMIKKSAWFPWMTQETTTLNRLVSAAGAFIGSIGVHMAFSAGQATAPDGTYLITVTGLTLANVGAGLWHWMNQFAGQQLLYDGIVSKTSPKTPQAVTSVPQPAAVKAELQGVKA